jgi:hypothetical protein
MIPAATPTMTITTTKKDMKLTESPEMTQLLPSRSFLIVSSGWQFRLYEDIL